jgi:hypothetical protein
MARSRARRPSCGQREEHTIIQALAPSFAGMNELSLRMSWHLYRCRKGRCRGCPTTRSDFEKASRACGSLNSRRPCCGLLQQDLRLRGGWDSSSDLANRQRLLLARVRLIAVPWKARLAKITHLSSPTSASSGSQAECPASNSRARFARAPTGATMSCRARYRSRVFAGTGPARIAGPRPAVQPKNRAGVCILNTPLPELAPVVAHALGVPP